MKNKRNRKVFSSGKNVILCFIIAFFLVGTTAVFMFYKQFKQTHFDFGTTIEEIDCSNLTVQEAIKKLENETNHVTFVFLAKIDTNTKRIINVNEEDLKEFQITIADTDKIQLALESQNKKEDNNNFQFENLFSVNEQAVKNYLEKLLKQQESFMIPCKDAYITLGPDHLLQIVPEEYGTEVDFDVIYAQTIKCLKNGITRIDFTSFAKKPQILSTNAELVNVRDSINNVLSTNITVNLQNGTVVSTLEPNTILQWLEYAENEKSYTINVNDMINSFVDSILENLYTNNAVGVFYATDIGNIELRVRSDLIPKINKEELANEIMSNLGKTKTITITYNKNSFFDGLSTYIELDITRQTVWFYIDGNCILKTDCVTGNESRGDGTPTGIYFLDWKTTDTYLRGYNYDGSRYSSHVNYWMPFNGGIGFHDAYWRYGLFGGQYYKTEGSHGCVNLPLEAAKIMYENINSSIPIIIYKS